MDRRRSVSSHKRKFSPYGVIFYPLFILDTFLYDNITLMRVHQEDGKCYFR
ncbi:MAG: hypothetical protein ACI9JL_004269 [Paracoccaceae bacterium]|jgi:hypothetical protein